MLHSMTAFRVELDDESSKPQDKAS